MGFKASGKPGMPPAPPNAPEALYRAPTGLPDLGALPPPPGGNQGRYTCPHCDETSCYCCAFCGRNVLEHEEPCDENPKGLTSRQAWEAEGYAVAEALGLHDRHVIIPPGGLGKLTKCWQCQYWAGTGRDDDSEGKCYRLAPHPIMHVQLGVTFGMHEEAAYRVIWPVTLAHDGCGMGSPP